MASCLKISTLGVRDKPYVTVWYHSARSFHWLFEQAASVVALDEPTLSRRFFALTTLRLLFLLASGLAALVCVDAWRNKIWPKLRGAYTFVHCKHNVWSERRQ